MRHAIPLLAAATLVMVPPASAQDLTRLGKVEFKVVCNAEAQREFHRAMALYHSFAWPAAAAAFEAIAKADPRCGMAHWGRAMTLLDNPFTWPAGMTSQKLNDVAAMLDAAEKAGLNSEREKGLVAAVRIFVTDHEKLPHAIRMQSFEDALGKLAANYPDDSEVSILFALVTSANFKPADKAYTNQLKAARILEPIFKAQPNHPGAAHYMIHSYDYPPIAKHGVGAARKYAAIAPDAPHAQHMPSHIFTRLGLWEDSIKANRASATSAGSATFDGHHARDYMVYAHLQLAQDQAAQRTADESRGMKPIDHFASAYAYAAMPARIALERGDWKAAATLPLQPAADAYPWKKYPQSEAVNAFARGIGAAMTNDVAGARAQKARLLSLRDAAKDAKILYWAEQIDIQAAIVDALAFCGEGKTQDCLAALAKAATREDATEKHVVTPGPILPARELLADLLLAAGKPADALQEYEAVLAKEPNRYRSIAGAMQAADRLGDRQKARKFATDLVNQVAKADSDRPALTLAKRLTAAN